MSYSRRATDSWFCDAPECAERVSYTFPMFSGAPCPVPAFAPHGWVALSVDGTILEHYCAKHAPKRIGEP